MTGLLLSSSGTALLVGGLATLGTASGSLTITEATDAEASSTLAYVAPTVVWLEATPSGLGTSGVTLPALDSTSTPFTGTGNLIYDDHFHEVWYFWKITTHPAGYATTYSPDSDYNMPTAWNDRRIAYGQKVAFVLDEPGSYTITCYAVGPTGTTATQTVSYTVADPDTAYPTTATICVNPAGDTDFTWAPTGSDNYSTGADDTAVLNTALATYNDGTNTSFRLLFKPGASYNLRGTLTNAWSATNDTRLRHYVGTPLGTAKAILNIGGTTNGPQFADAADLASTTVYNLDIRGPLDPSAGVPKSNDDFVEVALPSMWSLPGGGSTGYGSANTHHNVHKLKISGIPVQLKFPSGAAEHVANGKGTLPRILVSETFFESVADDNGAYTITNNSPGITNGGTALGVTQKPKLALIGCKIATPTNLLSPTQSPYMGSACILFRASYVGDCYFGATDWYLQHEGAEIVRCHQGGVGFSPYPRYGWAYYNWDRTVMENGRSGLNIMANIPGSPTIEASPANVMVDKFLRISRPGEFRCLGDGGSLLCPGTYRNMTLVVPPGSLFGQWYCLVDDVTSPTSAQNHCRAHPYEFYNITFVTTANSTQTISTTPVKIVNTNSLSGLTEENNVQHYPNLTHVTIDADPMTSGTLAGVTPRSPGIYDSQALFSPASLTSASISNGATFDVLFSEIDAEQTASTSQTYTAASSTYWSSNPTHKQHFIRQSSTYYYVGNGDLSVTELSDRLRFTNNTGVTLSGTWEIWIDRRGLHPGADATKAVSASLHLSWVPASGSPALDAYSTGLLAHDDFLGNVRSGKKDPENSFNVVAGTAEIGAFEA